MGGGVSKIIKYRLMSFMDDPLDIYTFWNNFHINIFFNQNVLKCLNFQMPQFSTVFDHFKWNFDTKQIHVSPIIARVKILTDLVM